MQVIMHPSTKRAVKTFINKPAHSLLLSAPLGSGKFYLAKYIASRLLHENEMPANYAFSHYIEPRDGIITIDAIRELKNFLQLKTSGQGQIRRFVIIEQAEAMNTEAQNALLKILEEPPHDTLIIMTTSNPNSLSSTIRSRLQHIAVLRPSKQQLENYFGTQHPLEEYNRAYHMSEGRIGLMHALLEKSDHQHPFAEHINLAKTVFQKPVHERLVSIGELLNIDLQMLCQGLYSVAHAALVSAAEKHNEHQTKKWHQTCQLIHKTQGQLRYKPSSKLLLTHLFVNL